MQILQLLKIEDVFLYTSCTVVSIKHLAVLCLPVNLIFLK